MLAVVGLPTHRPREPRRDARLTAAPPAKAAVGSIVYSTCDFNGSGTIYQLAPDDDPGESARPRREPTACRLTADRRQPRLLDGRHVGARRHQRALLLVGESRRQRRQVAWSPDGKHLTFPSRSTSSPASRRAQFEQGAIATVDDTANATPTNSDLPGSDGSFDWSSTGTGSSARSSASRTARSKAGDSQGPPAFTTDPANLAEPTPLPDFSKYFSPRYRPDGTPAWAGVRNSGANHEIGLFVNGTYWLNLPNIESFTFSPDGLWVAVAIAIGGSDRIDVYRFDGTFGYTLSSNGHTVCGLDSPAPRSPRRRSRSDRDRFDARRVPARLDEHEPGRRADARPAMDDLERPDRHRSVDPRNGYEARHLHRHVEGHESGRTIHDQHAIDHVKAPTLSVAPTITTTANVVPGDPVKVDVTIAASADGVGD